MVKFFKRESSDLFKNRLFRFIFKNQRFIFILRVAVTLLFFYAILMGFYDSSKENIFTTALFWGLFWPFFIVTTLPTFGRIFCGICPHGFLGKYITRIGLQKKMPKWMQNRFIGVMLLVVGWWAVYYMFPGLYRTPFGTAMLFTVMTLLAFVLYYLYKDMSYCKYICPIGTALRAFGKLSFTSFGTYQSACSSCKTFDCAKSCPYGLSPFNFEKKESMGDCTLCMECTTSCEAVRFRFVKPGHAIYQKFKTLKAEVWVYILILAAIPISMAFSHGLGRSKIADEMIWAKTAAFFERFIDFGSLNATGLFAFLYAVLFSVLAAVIGMFIASKILKKEYTTVFYTLGYAFAPLFILGSMAHAWEFFFTSNSARIVEGMAWGFGFNIDVEPLAKRGDTWLEVFHLFRWVAVAWAFYILYRRMAHIDASRVRKIMAFPFAGLLILFFIGVNSYRSYVLDTYGRAERSHMMGGHRMGNMHGGTRFQTVKPQEATILQKGKDATSCVVCGMNLPMFYKTNHAAHYHGKEQQYCSIHCLAEALHLKKSKLQNIRVVDTKSLKFIDAKSAFYVVGSKKSATMSKVSKYAFASLVDAKAFAKANGGEVVRFDEALKIALEDFNGQKKLSKHVSMNDALFFDTKKPSAKKGGMHHGGMGGMMHHGGGANAIPSRSVWLLTGDIASPQCVENIEGAFYTVDTENMVSKPRLKQRGGCSSVSFKMPKSGYYKVYYVVETNEGVNVAKYEFKRFNHSSDEKYDKEKMKAKTITEVPFDILRLRSHDETFYSRPVTGELLRFQVRKAQEPVAGAKVVLQTQFGWQKVGYTDKNGTVAFRLIKDYYPQWDKFNKRFREKYLVTATYNQEHGKAYRVSMADEFRPARSEYQSYAYALLTALLLLIVFGGGVFLYRYRTQKPFKEVVIDDK